MSILGGFIVGGTIALFSGTVVHHYRTRARREQFIRHYMFPGGVFQKFAQVRPNLDAKQQQLVARALRQFFLVYLKSGGRRVAMPSQVVDDLWHEFILFTREYHGFCERAFGRFLHHTPAVAVGKVASDNEGLRRVWWFACLEENINPRDATRLPLLFALDRKLGIEGGYVYDLHCRRQRDKDSGGCSGGGGTTHCADTFNDSSVDWNTGAGGSGDGVFGDAGGGCGGGCGGGD